MIATRAAAHFAEDRVVLCDRRQPAKEAVEQQSKVNARDA
ncbi:hypothetical protein NMYAN_130092 [Nitrosomonas nitrosa]|uniref:Uncharacterized protein n=1 Tax=Nitrosomonas nitrosa TaxID=52442 RepID=A0A8H9D886_9PROT|nr:hypothetical protein NMYAN_130092 [Nitrosomonas nitrosa]